MTAGSAGPPPPPRPRPRDPEAESARGRREVRPPTTERSGWIAPSGRGYAATAEAPGGFDVVSVLGVLKRRAWVVILCTLLVGGGIYAYYDRQPKSYVATAKLLFSNPGLDQAIVAPNARTQATDPEREAATNLAGLAVRPVAQRTARAIGGGLSPGAVVAHIDVNADGRSDFVSVRASAADPQLAARMATTYAREYIAYRRAKTVAQIRAAQTVVRRRLDAAVADDTPRSNRAAEPALPQSIQRARRGAHAAGAGQPAQRARVASDRWRRTCGGGAATDVGRGAAYDAQRHPRRHRRPAARRVARVPVRTARPTRQGTRPAAGQLPSADRRQDPRKPRPAQAEEVHRGRASRVRGRGVPSALGEPALLQRRPGHPLSAGDVPDPGRGKDDDRAARRRDRGEHRVPYAA